MEWGVIKRRFCSFSCEACEKNHHQNDESMKHLWEASFLLLGAHFPLNWIPRLSFPSYVFFLSFVYSHFWCCDSAVAVIESLGEKWYTTKDWNSWFLFVLTKVYIRKHFYGSHSTLHLLLPWNLYFIVTAYLSISHSIIATQRIVSISLHHGHPRGLLKIMTLGSLPTSTEAKLVRVDLRNLHCKLKFW